MNQPQTIVTQPGQTTNGQTTNGHATNGEAANGHSSHAPVPGAMGAQYEPCSQCGAPLERQQRYCVNCAARRGDAANPASRYLAAATRSRRGTAASSGTPQKRQGSGTRVAAVGFFALLPLAVAIGVLVGRGGGDSGPVQLVGGAGATAADSSAGTNVSNSPSKLLPSDFSLDKGYTVKLDLLPIESTDQPAAQSAESDAKSKGASSVGIINPGDFTTTPDQGQKDYVLYSGEYKQKGDAQKALGKLKKAFPSAEVIAVAASSGGGGSKASTAAGSKVLAHTSHGTIHSAVGYKPSPQKVAQDTARARRNANLTGQAYVNAQRNSPDIQTIGGDPNNAPPLPTGAGD